MVIEYRNPVLPGFHPDPSICRAGDDYYLVTSSFEYFPGVPIFHSRDLVHWRAIGHALTRREQLALDGVKSSEGIFAPTIRYHAGTFHLITTIMPSGRAFAVSATDPAGDWSDPVWFDESEFAMDPSLLFDDDGKVYYTRHGGGRHGGIYQAEIDLSAGRLCSAPRRIWSGTGDIWPEGPHLYKIGSQYYLLIAEGGTSYDHMVTVARAASPWGPFTPAPNNPIFTHRHLPDHPIQALGHADLVQAPDGSWWLVCLGIRPASDKHHHLGRETFLAPVTWSADGWPIVNGGRPLELRMSAVGLPRPEPWPGERPRDDFEAPRLSLAWNFVRNPSPALFSLAARPGYLRLFGTAVSLDDLGAPAFVGRRQQHLRCRASTRVEFEPTADGQEAGLSVRGNEANHYDLGVLRRGGKCWIRLRLRSGGVTRLGHELPLRSAGPITLSAEATPEYYEFSFAGDDGAKQALGSAPTAPLSSEVAGGFTGVYLGMYAVAADSSETAVADFDWFEYLPDSDF
jgi:alpha-N-arabinofuranosidase